MKKKNILALACVFLMMIGILSGCGGGEEPLTRRKTSRVWSPTPLAAAPTTSPVLWRPTLIYLCPSPAPL